MSVDELADVIINTNSDQRFYLLDKLLSRAPGRYKQVVQTLVNQRRISPEEGEYLLGNLNMLTRVSRNVRGAVDAYSYPFQSAAQYARWSYEKDGNPFKAGAKYVQTLFPGLLRVTKYGY